MDKIQKAQLKFLDEMCAHFNSGNRGIDTNFNGNRCSYSAGCAIGRKLSKDLCDKLDNGDTTGVSSGSVFEQLPKYLRLMGRKFLMDCQNFHDSEGQWIINGMSPSGKNTKEVMKNRIKTGYYKTK